MKLEQLNEMVKSGELKKLHTSWARGYVSRKGEGIIVEYKGRFGTGYKYLSPSFNSSQYCYVTYFVK